MAICIAGAGALAIPGYTLCQPKARPNIVIVIADDLGWGDVGYHGSTIRTPNIDRLASEGLEMDRFYTAALSSPTRAGFLTGRYPDRFGIRNIVIRPWLNYGLDPTEETLPKILSQNGYDNRAIIGKWHLGHLDLKYHPLNNGFTHFYGCLNGAIDYFNKKRNGEPDWHRDFEVCHDKGYSTELITSEAVRCIEDYSKQKTPFFLCVTYNAPHVPLEAQPEDLQIYTGDRNISDFDSATAKRLIYSAMVTCMDRGIGQIYKALQQSGVSDNTLFIFFSDNGADVNSGGGSSGILRGQKNTEWEGGVRAPAFIHYPAFSGDGRKITQLTGYVDIVPTIRDLLGVTTAPQRPLDGISVLAALREPDVKIERTMYLGRGAAIDSDGNKYLSPGHNPLMTDLNGVLLTNVFTDPGEQKSKNKKNSTLSHSLQRVVQQYDTIVPPQIPKGHPKTFLPPKNWDITQ
ncbi:arylsulfatase [uncultured Alistipes sp.]|uniref:arylsulfatase B n=1 Tax=uncultured Alistipes sp. TaxID=538949 RepID=UPI00320A0428